MEWKGLFDRLTVEILRLSGWQGAQDWASGGGLHHANQRSRRCPAGSRRELEDLRTGLVMPRC